MNLNSFSLTAIAVFTLLGEGVFTGNLQSAQVDWSSEVGSSLLGNGTGITGVASGGFPDGFVPTNENSDEWSAHWVESGSATYNSNFRFFGGSVMMENVNLIGKQGYIWVKQDLEVGPGILITNLEWVWQGGSALGVPQKWVADESSTVFGTLIETGVGTGPGDGDGGTDGGSVTPGVDWNTGRQGRRPGSRLEGPGQVKRSYFLNDKFSGLFVDPKRKTPLGEISRLSLSGRNKVFTGRGIFGSNSVRFRGSFTKDRLNGLVLNGKMKGMTLNGRIIEKFGRINLSLRDDDGIVAQSRLNKAGPLGGPGRSTLLFLAKGEVGGYGTLNVATNGRSRMQVTMPDGRKFARSGYASDNGIAFYKRLYGGNGTFAGTLSLRDLEGVSDFDGKVIWKPGKSKRATLAALGSRFTAHSVVNQIFPGLTGEMALFNSDIPAVINWNDEMTVFTGENLNGALNPYTGYFSGNMTDGSHFGGVLFGDQNAGGGMVREPNGAIGSISISGEHSD